MIGGGIYVRWVKNVVVFGLNMLGDEEVVY